MATLTDRKDLVTELEAAFLKSGGAAVLMRKTAFDALISTGLPGNKTEEYKYTPVTRVLEKILDLNAAPSLVSPIAKQNLKLIPGLDCYSIVFVNGHYSRELSDTGEIRINVMDTDSSEPGIDPFNRLNFSFHSSFVQVLIEKDQVVSKPLAFVYLFDSPEFVFANPRWSINAGERSDFSVIEYSVQTGSNQYFNNKQSVIEVGDSASLQFLSWQNGSSSEVLINNSAIRAAESARVSCFHYTMGGNLVRNNLTLSLDGEKIDAHLYGLYLVNKNTLADNHTVVDHRKPNSFSNELYKGILSGQARGVFNGKIFVRPDAQKTNAFQSNRNILLSESASVNTKPQLEIWADDVKCSHGCTTGQLDEEALFYLQSRGISKSNALSMLLHAFAAETIAPIRDEKVRNFLDGVINEKLASDF